MQPDNQTGGLDWHSAGTDPDVAVGFGDDSASGGIVGQYRKLVPCSAKEQQILLVALHSRTATHPVTRWAEYHTTGTHKADKAGVISYFIINKY